MSNPFEGKSLTELLDGVPGYTDMELDVLCACVCNGEWVKVAGLDWYRYIHWIKHWMPLRGSINLIWIYAPTTDWREAGRLLKKYRLQIGELNYNDEWWVGHSLYLIGEGQEEPLARHDNPCRAITEAAVAAALTEMINAEPSNK